MSDDPVRQRILEVAGELAQGGNLTMSRVAKAAGVSRSSLYRRFERLESLQQALRDQGQGANSTRDRILLAARNRISEAGLRGGTIQVIADEAGVGVATVYSHFPDKGTLLRGVIERYGPKGVTDPLLDPTLDFEEALMAFARKALLFFRSQHGLVRVIFAPDPDMLALVQTYVKDPTSFEARVMAFMGKGIDEGRLQGDIRHLTISFLGLILAHGCLPPVLPLPKPPLEETAQGIVDLFLRGVRV